MNLKDMPFKLIALLGLLAFSVTLAIIIGQRLSTEAMAVLMGVVAGVAASIPTSMIVVWIATQSMTRPHYPTRPEPRETPSPVPAEAPCIVVVQQPAAAPAYPQPAWN